MASLQKIAWMGSVPRSLSAESSLAKLVNCYPTRDRTNIALTRAPGAMDFFAVDSAAIAGVTPTAANGIQALLAIDSPTYGVRFFGIHGAFRFFEVRLGGSNANDPSANYQDILNVNSGITVHTETTRRFNFTTNARNTEAGPIKLVTDGRRIAFVVKRNLYMWDMAKDSGTGGFISVVAPTPENAAATLPDEEWADIAYIDQYWFLVSRGGQIFHSNVGSAEFDQLDFAYASYRPDEAVGMEVYSRRLYIFGSESIESWFNQPTPNRAFSFKRDNAFSVDVGCLSKHTIRRWIGGITFVGNDHVVYDLRGTTPYRLSNDAIERAIKDADREVLRAYIYNEDGHYFYVLTLSDDTGVNDLVYDFIQEQWHEREGRYVGVLAHTSLRGENYVTYGSKSSFDATVSQPLRAGTTPGV